METLHTRNPLTEHFIRNTSFTKGNLYTRVDLETLTSTIRMEKKVNCDCMIVATRLSGCRVSGILGIFLQNGVKNKKVTVLFQKKGQRKAARLVQSLE